MCEVFFMVPVSSGFTTDGLLKVDLTLDWLSFTYKSPKAPSDTSLPYNHFFDFCRDFPEFDSYIKEHGVTLARQRGWYDTVLQFTDNIRINYCSDRDKNNSNHLGVNVEIPSHGLLTIMSLFGFQDDQVVEFFNLLRGRHCKASRLDLAFDDYTKTFKPIDFCRFWSDGMISTKFRRANLIMSSSLDGGTFYLGDRGSGKMLRIYDKDFESKGLIKSIRYEVELHSGYADEMLNYIADGNDLSFSSYIVNFFRVITRDGVRHMSGSSLPKTLTSVRSMCPTDPRWSEFLRKMQVLRRVEKVKVPHAPRSVSSLSLKRWINSISGALRAFNDLVGEVTFRDIIARARVPDRYLLNIPELSDLYFLNRSEFFIRSSRDLFDLENVDCRFDCDLI